MDVPWAIDAPSSLGQYPAKAVVHKSWMITVFSPMKRNTLAIVLGITLALLPSQEINAMDKKIPSATMSPGEIADLYKNFDYAGRSLSISQFIKSSQQPNTVMLDLRDLKEYRKGHIKGALHIGADVTLDKLNQLVPDYHTTILVYCVNSFQLTRKLSLTHTVAPQICALGYKQVYLLEAALELRSNPEIEKAIPWEGDRNY